MYTNLLPASRTVQSLHSLENGGGTISDNSRLITLTSTKSGTRVEKYRDKIKNGGNAVSDYTLDIYDVHEWEGDFTLRYRYYHIPAVTYGERFQGIKTPAEEFSHLLNYSDIDGNKALQKIYRKIEKDRTSVSGLVVLGELTKTLQQLRNPYAALRKAWTNRVNDLEKVKNKVAKSPIKVRRRDWEDAVTSSYLETVFGIMPLVSDINGLLQASDRLHDGKPFRKRFVSRSVVTSNKTYDPTFGGYVTPGNTGYFLHFGEWKHSTETEMRVQFNVGMSSSERCEGASLKRAMSLTGFRLDQFIPSIYQCLPWSWAVDYFSNVGNLLTAGSMSQTDVEYVGRTISRRSIDSKQVVPRSPGEYTTFFNANGTIQYLGQSPGDFGRSVCIRTTVERKKLTEIPMPRFELTHPGLLSKQSVNLAAVLLQRKRLSDLTWLSSKGP